MGKLKEQLQKKFDSITYQIATIIILLIMPLNIVVILSTTNSINVIQEQAKISLESVLNLYVQELENRISTGNYFLYNMAANDADFIRLMKQEGGNEYMLSKTRAANEMNSQLSSTGTANGYFYYATELDDAAVLLSKTPEGFSGMDLLNARKNLTNWVKTEQLDAYRHWTIVTVGEHQWLVRVQSSGSFYYGMFISLDEMTAIFKKDIEFQSLSVRYNDTDVDKNCISAAGEVENGDMTITLAVDKREIIHGLPKLQFVAILVACLYVLLIPALILILNHMILRPLNRIRTALINLKQGQREYRIHKHKYAEEFRSINQSFNEMADNIEALKIENYEKELQRQKMELRNLQLQIHPHFLLNMFNLVHSLAQIADYQNIQKLALYLSNYFRYIFRSGQDTEPFEQELALIREYLDISEIRYPSGYEVDYDIEAETLGIQIPPLLIHNFVENILKHALVPDRIVHILIVAHYADGWAEFMIVDDGAGMPEEMVDAINKEQYKYPMDKQVHVGIANSSARIKSFYGKESTVSVESMKDQGTCFTIRFPYTLEETV